jgi:hypothetical protein
MRQRIGSHLTFANVVSLAALFVAVGGTATAATYVVSSNSQIGPGTVSGHKPPTGKHANIIGGSVSGQDVANDSLTGADVNESTLTGNTRTLLYQAKTSVSPPHTTIAAVGPYAIKGQCADLGGATGVNLWANGPAGSADVMYQTTRNDLTDQGAHSHTLSLGAHTDTAIVGVSATPPDSWRIAGTAMLRTGSTLVQVDFDIVADPGACTIHGTATRAT